MGSQANVFTTMPLIPDRIIMALMENDNFCKLMYYNTIDALDRPVLTIEQKQKLIWDGIEDHMENPYFHAELRRIFGLDRQIMLSDIHH